MTRADFINSFKNNTNIGEKELWRFFKNNTNIGEKELWSFCKCCISRSGRSVYQQPYCKQHVDH